MTVIIFDMDGVLVDSEQVWDQARRDVVAAHGGTWKDSATRDMLGMSSKEWSVYVVEQLGTPLTPEQVNAAVVEAMLRGYERHLPLLPGAREAIEQKHWAAAEREMRRLAGVLDAESELLERARALLAAPAR